MRIAIQQVPATIGFIICGLLIFAAGCCVGKESDGVGVEKPAAEEPVKKTFTANQFCAACHYAFAEEDLALVHEQAGIGCERCHGESERHRSDEDNVTPPEIMYPDDKIIPTCMMCHPRDEIEHVPAHSVILAGAKTIFDSEPEENAPPITCTFCHAKQHRINVRTIRWNKATGQVLDE